MTGEQREVHEATILDSLTLLAPLAPHLPSAHGESLKCQACAAGCEERAKARLAALDPGQLVLLDNYLARAVELLGEGAAPLLAAGF